MWEKIKGQKKEDKISHIKAAFCFLLYVSTQLLSQFS